MAVGHSDDIDVERALDDGHRGVRGGARGRDPDGGPALRLVGVRPPGDDRPDPGPLSGDRACGGVIGRRDVVGPRILRGLGGPRPVRGRRRSRSGRASGGTCSGDPVVGVPAGRRGRTRPIRPCAQPVHRAAGDRAASSASVTARGAARRLGPDVPILGGGPAPRDPSINPASGIEGGLQIAGDVVTDDAIAVLLFCGPLALSFGVDTGWRGVGPRAAGHAPVRRQRDRDRRAAGDRVLRALSRRRPSPRSPTRSRCSRPRARTASTSGRPSPTTRTRGCVTFFGGVPDGRRRCSSPSRRPTRSSMAHGRRSGTRWRASRRATRPDAALIFSCATRRSCWGPAPAARSRSSARSSAMSTPVAGFYCMGEIAPMASGDHPQFHNATMVVGPARVRVTGWPMRKRGRRREPRRDPRRRRGGPRAREPEPHAGA